MTLRLKGYEFSKFSLGYDNVAVPGSLKSGALADCKNFNITRQGKLSKRKGMSTLYSTACGSSADVNSIYEYKSPGGEYVSAYVLVASGTKVYSYYNSTWNEVKNSLTDGLKHSFVTHLGMCYCANGTDSNFKIYSDGSNVTNATAYNLGIAAPESGSTPTVSATTLTYTRRYLSTNQFKGQYGFCEFSDKLTVLDLHSTLNHASILSTSDGTTWTEAFEIADDNAGIPSGHNFFDMDGSSVASYGGLFWFNLYDATSYYTMGTWDGSTTVAIKQTAFKPDGTNNNCYGYGLYEYDSKLWWITDVTENIGDNYRCVHYYDGSSVSSINAASSYGSGNAYLAHNKSSGLPDYDIMRRCTQLFSWGDTLWLFATVYDSTNSKWAWEVWEIEKNFTMFTKRYDSDDINDGYAFSAIWASQDGNTVYVLGNQLSAGSPTEQARLYKSTDMYNWEAVRSEFTLGFPYGVCTHNDITMIHCQDDTTNNNFVYKFSDTDEDFTLEQTITTNTADEEVGEIISWDNGTNTQLYLGKYKEIYERSAYELTGISGHTYKYCYKRNAWKPFTGNPSSASSSIAPVSGRVDIGVTASADPQVDKIVIYRTLDGGSTYYKHSEVANSTATIVDSTVDGSLTTELEYDNTVPPKAKYLTLHNDRVIYMNCPAETDGESLVMWSKAGYGEAVPSVNYQYFDRDDGEDIVGGASIGDYLVVFKRNKFSVLVGDFDESSELYTTGYGVGCVSHYTIIPFEDKVIFLSEEGWKAFDGKNLYSLSETVNGWREDGYYTTAQAANYQSVYYPEREQFLTLMKHTTEDDIVATGHFLIPLMMAAEGAPEFGTGVLAAWTYHQYDNHTLTTLGTYTDSSNITRALAGDSGGFVYLLDTGTQDVTSNIAYIFKTDWSALGVGKFTDKVARKGLLAYTSSTTDNMTFNIEKDFSDTDDTQTLACVTSGVGDADIKKIHLSGTGRVFRYTISGTTAQDLSIIALQIYFKDLGMRP